MAESNETGRELDVDLMEQACNALHQEIFCVSRRDLDSEPDHFGNQSGYGVGWYYWTCLPGCLPDSDPSGPYATCDDAISECFEANEESALEAYFELISGDVDQLFDFLLNFPDLASDYDATDLLVEAIEAIEDEDRREKFTSEIVDILLDDQDVTWAVEYAEPGYTDPEYGILLANWNDVKHGDLLESLGYSCEWSDEWEICDDCQRAIRKSPDCYDWTYYGHTDDHGHTSCGDCIEEDPEYYLEGLIDNPDRLDTIGIDLEDLGFQRLPGDCDHGMYRANANHDPHSIMDRIHEIDPDIEVVFGDLQPSQFESRWSVYVRLPELDFRSWECNCGHQFDAVVRLSESTANLSGEATVFCPKCSNRAQFGSKVFEDRPEISDELLEEIGNVVEDTAKPGDVARRMEEGLKAASRAMSELPDDQGIKYAKVNADGSADVRIVNSEEFISGIKDD